MVDNKKQTLMMDRSETVLDTIHERDRQTDEQTNGHRTTA